MKIGVLDTDGDFKHRFFRDKKLDIQESRAMHCHQYNPLSNHSEFRCRMMCRYLLLQSVIHLLSLYSPPLFMFLF